MSRWWNVCWAGLLLSPTLSAEEIPTVEQLLDRSLEALAKTEDYTGIMHKYERRKDGSGQVEKMRIKFARPFRVYIKFLNVYNGREAIYVQGQNDNRVKVHKGNFPDVTINLDTKGSTAMEGNHHPITDFGLENTVKVCRGNLKRALERKEGTIRVEAGEPFDGRATWKISSSFPQGGSNTPAKDGETLWDVARRTEQDMYLILYTNKDYDDPDDPDEGDPVFVPNYYGSRSELILDRETYLLLKASSWDWSGNLYESYEYHEMQYNAGLKPSDFDAKNKDYNF